MSLQFWRALEFSIIDHFLRETWELGKGGSAFGVEGEGLLLIWILSVMALNPFIMGL